VNSEETALIQTDRKYCAVQTEQCYTQLETYRVTDVEGKDKGEHKGEDKRKTVR
jgi:hypothetical protein